MATLEQSLISQYLALKDDTKLWNLAAILVGVALLGCLAQVSISLPWTPVPITGQTFGVALVSLLWGRKRAFAVLSSYLLLGSFGLPIFAMGKAGFVIGPTSGYLIGMWIASFIMGSFADRGCSQRFFSAWLSTQCGSLIVFTCGLIGLSLFVPSAELLNLGLWPFLPGDLVKTSLAAWIVSRSHIFSHRHLEA